MQHHGVGRAVFFAALGSSVVALAACGSRTDIGSIPSVAPAAAVDHRQTESLIVNRLVVDPLTKSPAPSPTPVTVTIRLSPLSLRPIAGGISPLPSPTPAPKASAPVKSEKLGP